MQLANECGNYVSRLLLAISRRFEALAITSAYMGRLQSRRFWLVAHYPFSCSSVLVS